MLVKLIAILLGRKELWLQDYKGDIYHTFEAAWNPLGRWCRIYPLTRVGVVLFEDNGKVEVDGTSCYIRQWYDKCPLKEEGKI